MTKPHIERIWRFVLILKITMSVVASLRRILL
jgi:hypothetical protein